jgi:ABC-type transporter Mla MlaB component
MLTLQLDEEQIANIKVSILNTAKMPNVDESGMVVLLALIQEIDRQVAEQSQVSE